MTTYTEEENDIDAKLAALDQKMMVHSLRNITLESLEDDNEKMEGSELECLPQYTHLNNKGKQDLFGEWMDSIEHLDAFVTNKRTDIEIDDKAIDYMDEDPTVLMLKQEGIYWEPLAIVEATTELKN